METQLFRTGEKRNCWLPGSIYEVFPKSRYLLTDRDGANIYSGDEFPVQVCQKCLESLPEGKSVCPLCGEENNIYDLFAGVEELEAQVQTEVEERRSRLEAELNERIRHTNLLYYHMDFFRRTL